MDRIRSRTPPPQQPSQCMDRIRRQILEENATSMGIQMPLGIRVLPTSSPTRETADTRVLARSTTATTVQDVDESDADVQPDAQPAP